MFLTAVVFIAILSLLVLIHEFGHFLAAKKMGILVEEFGFGLPPRIFGKKIGETVYSINALPIGGFVKLHGEETEDDAWIVQKIKKFNLKRTFFTRPKWQRTIVLTAGVFMNFLLGVVIISFVFTQGVMVPSDKIHIEKVVENSPAQESGLIAGDVIVSIDGKPIKSGSEMISYTKDHLGQTLNLKIKRGEEMEDLAITPRKIYPQDQGPMGVIISNFEEKKYTLWEAPIFGTWEALRLSGLILVALGAMLRDLILTGAVPQDVAGPVGIVQVTSQVVKFGPLAVLELTALISINLAVVNILPFPALDGGRLFFVGVEALTGRRVKPRFERIAHQIGFFLLIILILLITYHDLLRFNLWENIRKLLP